MSKISQYLNEHLLGEVSAQADVLRAASQDNGILSLIPDIVVWPRTTNDIRKILRFTWQLAEKQHIIETTVRGNGSGVSGGSIGKGIVLDTSAHFNQVIYIAPKGRDRFVHVQSGASLKTLNTVLESQGLTLHSKGAGTVGGALSDSRTDIEDETANVLAHHVQKLEVVLASGDVIETGRMSRRELSKHKGLPTLEGEIYRNLDDLLDKNANLIESMPKTVSPAGYGGIKDVRGKDGSFDLTPLFVGAQGTLGVITEVMLDADFASSVDTVAVISFTDAAAARDAADKIAALEPSVLDYFDGSMFMVAQSHGKNYKLVDTANTKAVLYVGFGDFSDRAQARKLKKLRKLISKNFLGAALATSEEYPLEELQAVRGVETITRLPLSDNDTLVDIFNGFIVPANAMDEFVGAVRALGDQYNIDLPLMINWLSGAVSIPVALRFDALSDRQKVFRVLESYTQLVLERGGQVAAEGRLISNSYYNDISQGEIELYAAIRKIFDPLGTLNAGVKTPVDLRRTVAMFNADDRHRLSSL